MALSDFCFDILKQMGDAVHDYADCDEKTEHWITFMCIMFALADLSSDLDNRNGRDAYDVRAFANKVILLNLLNHQVGDEQRERANKMLLRIAPFVHRIPEAVRQEYMFSMSDGGADFAVKEPSLYIPVDKVFKQMIH